MSVLGIDQLQQEVVPEITNLIQETIEWVETVVVVIMTPKDDPYTALKLLLTRIQRSNGGEMVPITGSPQIHLQEAL